MRQYRVLLVLCVGMTAGLLGGCGASGRTHGPSWIEGTSREYPADQYLIGVGQADAPSVAAERAYGAVARIFKAEVSAQSKDWESFLLLENRRGASAERRLTLDQVTRVSTDKVLENVSLLETWVDRRTGQHYAMAGTNRAQAAAALMERLADLDGAVGVETTEARRSSDGLARVRHLRRALKSLVLREAYNADLRVVRASGQGVASSYRVAELTTELERVLASTLVVGVEVTGDQADAVRRAVMEGLIREGLPVTDRRPGTDTAPGAEGEGKPTELMVKGTVRLRSAAVPDPQFKYVRWCSDFVIVEAGSQHVVGAVSRGGREGHVTAAEASAKALRVMQQEVTADLAKTLAGYVYGDIEAPVTIPPAACPSGEGQTG